jgi:alcohol dehydrogenase class IV
VDIARILTGNPDAGAADGVDWVRRLIRELGIPPLREYGVGERDFPVLVERAAKASSMKANPTGLTAEELRDVLELAIGGGVRS